ncbi:MAG: CvpA family protein [Proteobacteria bacterium]|nr:CvpA family protein [Pseudomonadota bacterium]
MGEILSVADVAIIGILLVSALWAFVRGFVREVLGVAAWVGAAFVTLYGFAYVRPYANQLISIAFVADAVAGVVLFVVSLILFSVVSHAISSQVRDSALSAIDRSLGFVFGLVRGAVIVCLGYLLLKWAVPPQDRPVWIMSARSLPAIEQGVVWLEQLIPRSARERGATEAEKARQKVQDAADAAKVYEALKNPPARAEPRGSAGPSKQDQRQLENLIQQSEEKK